MWYACVEFCVWVSCTVFCVSLQAMDRLKSEQHRLCECLSSDPEFLLSQCDGILLMKEYKEIEKQGSASEKTSVLLKIIIQKGEDTCQSFVDILRKHQAHYHQLQQFFNPVTQGKVCAWATNIHWIKSGTVSHKWRSSVLIFAGSLVPTVVADSSSVASARELTNIQSKSVNMNIEIERGPGLPQPGQYSPWHESSEWEWNTWLCFRDLLKCVIMTPWIENVSLRRPVSVSGWVLLFTFLLGDFTGQIPQANYMATGCSVIIADKITNATVDNLDFSVTIKASRDERAGNTQLSSDWLLAVAFTLLNLSLLLVKSVFVFLPLFSCQAQ